MQVSKNPVELYEVEIVLTPEEADWLLLLIGEVNMSYWESEPISFRANLQREIRNIIEPKKGTPT